MLNKGLRIVMVVALLTAVAGCGNDVAEQASAGELVDRELTAVHQWVKPPPIEPRLETGRHDPVDPVSEMLAGLEARLSQHPDDVKGWTLLAQSYAYVGRMSDADAAINRAVALGADRAGLERRVSAAHGDGS